MEVKINVDETQFKDIIEKELNAFTQEEIHQIVRDGLIQCMSNKETFQNLFVQEKSGYGYSSGGYEATQILKDAAKTIDFSPLYEEFKDNAIKYIRENQSKIFNEMLIQIFISGLGQNLTYPNNFMDNIRIEILNMIQPRNN